MISSPQLQRITRLKSGIVVTIKQILTFESSVHINYIQPRNNERALPFCCRAHSTVLEYELYRSEYSQILVIYRIARAGGELQHLEERYSNRL